MAGHSSSRCFGSLDGHQHCTPKVFKGLRVAARAAIYRSLQAPTRKKKVSKRVFLGGLQRSPLKKGEKRSENGCFAKLSRPDPCSVDFGHETPKFRFEFCHGFFGGFSPPIFSKEKKARKNPPKKSPARFTRDFVRKNSPRISAEAFNLLIDFFGYLRALFLRTPLKKTLLRLFLRFRAWEGPETPASGSSGRKLHDSDLPRANLSGVLNRDVRQYSCDTPYSAIGTRR